MKTKSIIVIVLLVSTIILNLPIIVNATDETLIDSWDGSKYTNTVYIYNEHPSATTHASARGQSVLLPNDGMSYTVTTVGFWLARQGNPTGNCYAVIYDSTGTHGTNALPTGSYIAISEPVDMSTISNSYHQENFTFIEANTTVLEPNTCYCIVFQIGAVGDASVDTSNSVHAGSDNVAPLHDGNRIGYASSAWYTGSGYHTCFYLYGEEVSGYFPYYYDFTDNGVTQVGKWVTFTVNWTDLDDNLDYYWFETNNTGVFVNSSASEFISASTNVVNINLFLNHTKNMFVMFRCWAIDDDDNLNVTGYRNVTTTPLYLTFYKNDSINYFYADFENKNNATSTGYDYNETVTLMGITYNSSYIWKSFNYTDTDIDENIYNYVTSDNETIWCYFDECSGVVSYDGFVEEEYFVLAFTLGCGVIGFIFITEKKRND